MNDPTFVHRVKAGMAMIEQGEFEPAERIFRELTAVYPRDAGLWNLLGAALHSARRFDEALAPYQKAVELDRRNPEFICNLGQTLLRLKRPEEAAKRFRATLAIVPNHAMALKYLGHALSDLGDLRQAESVFKRVIQRDPMNSEAYIDLADVYRLEMRLDEAEACYREGLARVQGSGDLHFCLAQQLLERARFGEAWVEYQFRFSRWDDLARAGLEFSAWRETPWGERLDGMEIELRAEQGLGDILFFLRFADEVRRRGARTLLYLPARLLEIVRRAECVDELRDEAQAPPLTRESVLVGDLPFLLGMQDGDVPPPLKLSPLPERMAAMRARLAACGPPPYTALTWRAGREVKNIYILKKEMPFDAFARVAAALPGTLVAVQRNPEAGEVARLAELSGRAVHDFSDTNADLEDALALMACLDDCVGVSNTNIHLLAGVGGHARVLVPWPYEWRWMAQGDASPWFAGFPVYRQQTNEDWSVAMDRLIGDVRPPHG
jgi:tetratricopeptide (TPR) repeat protein